MAAFSVSSTVSRTASKYVACLVEGQRCSDWKDYIVN